jgi:hypothetical protein
MNAPEEHPVLLRVIVGSRAHGLARPDSDYDYREVFIIPTSEMLSLGRDRMKFGWMSQGKHIDDEGGDEVAQFLHLCSKGAPNAVELCFAPLDEAWEPQVNVIPDAVQAAGRSVLSRDAVQAGVIGYAMNSFRKIEDRPGKWKAGMLRVLLQGRSLVQTGTMSLNVDDLPATDAATVRLAAANGLTDGQALDLANALVAEIKAGPSALPSKPDYEAANRWLLDLRRTFWEVPSTPTYLPADDPHIVAHWPPPSSVFADEGAATP